MSKLINMDGQTMASGQPAISGAQASAVVERLEIIDPKNSKPTRFNILVKIADVSSMSEGGLFLPETFFTKSLFDKTAGTLVSAGDEAFTGGNGDLWGQVPKIGDSVILSKNAGNLYRDEEKNLYRHVHDTDVCFIVEGE